MSTPPNDNVNNLEKQLKNAMNLLNNQNRDLRNRLNDELKDKKNQKKKLDEVKKEMNLMKMK